MYINSITIDSVRNISAMSWRIDPDQCVGWHVILGDNGSGKTNFVRSVALALVGPQEGVALRQDWSTWIQHNTYLGIVIVHVVPDTKIDRYIGRGKAPELPVVAVGFKRSQDGTVAIMSGHSGRGSRSPVHMEKSNRHVWSASSGWFSASYGPYRRFSGGDKDYERIFYSNPRLARHLSAFDERVALSECLRWLQNLQFKKLENDPEGDLLDVVVEFINQADFLPYNTQLSSVSSKTVQFVDGNGNLIAVEELSDGYRSILSLTFELIRQLAACYGPGKVFDPDDATKIIAPGVVLIDEVDAHLHPTWQRRIGPWFREHFPNIQFIVTTHSPLVCQAATHGTVFKLPTPGTDEQGRMIQGTELDRLLYGNILEAYSTEAFGVGITRSDESKKHLRRLAELNRKELHGELTKAEEKEQMELRAMLPTTAHTLNAGATV